MGAMGGIGALLSRQRANGAHMQQARESNLQLIQEALPAYAITEAEVNANKELQCTVCLSKFEPGEQVRRLPCMHVFHVDCIDDWIKRSRCTCPLDNLDIRKLIADSRYNEEAALGEVPAVICRGTARAHRRTQWIRLIEGLERENLYFSLTKCQFKMFARLFSTDFYTYMWIS